MISIPEEKAHYASTMSKYSAQLKYINIMIPTEEGHYANTLSKYSAQLKYM